jgi:CheY-like chemotaxis protein
MATGTSAVLSHRPRALVVDDSHIARYILSCELERLGYEVEVAESAEAAFRQLGQTLPNVIFMDHLLPGIDGLEAVKRLRGQSATSKLPIIMYTSQDSEEFAERARSIGADDTYVKTADESKLTGILERLNLLPELPVVAKKVGTVTPIRPQPSAPKQRPTVTREQLARLLEPSLEAHHAKLHHELLGEFAILERYEERMRRDLFARVETLARQTQDQFDHASRNERAARRRRGRWQALQAASLAACILVIATLGVRFAEDTAANTALLQQLAGSTLEATQANAETLAAVRQELDNLPTPVPVQPSVNAATALVDELQLMGILGPVRIETSAGAFCVSAGPNGASLISAYGPLQSCEQLPMQLTARSNVR